MLEKSDHVTVGNVNRYIGRHSIDIAVDRLSIDTRSTANMIRKILFRLNNSLPIDSLEFTYHNLWVKG